MSAPIHIAIKSVGFTSAGSKKGEISIVDMYHRQLIEVLQVRYRGGIPINVKSCSVEWGCYQPPPVSGKLDQNGGYLIEAVKNVVIDSSFMPPPPVRSRSSEQLSMEPPLAKKRKTSSSSSSNGGNSNNKQAPMTELPSSNPLFQRALSVLNELCLASHNATSSTPKASFNGSVFPGMSVKQHISNGNDVTDMINSERFICSWRPVGRRGLLLILRDGCFFIEKNGDFDGNSSTSENNNPLIISKAPNMYFPSPKTSSVSMTQHRTLLDGVLVEDLNPDGSLTKRYLAFDVLVHEGGVVSNKKLSLRLQFLSDGVIKPRKKEAKYNYEAECFAVRMKDIFELNKIKSLVENYLPKLTHKVDGIIFTNKDALYHVTGSGDGGAVEEEQRNGMCVWSGRRAKKVGVNDLVTAVVAISGKV